MSIMISRPGASLAVVDRPGTGAPVIFTHGAGMDSTSWDEVSEIVHESGRRVITWDLRGHGRSTLDVGRRFTAADALADLAALQHELGLHRPILVGHSLGGNLSQRSVRDAPAGAGGLVVIGSAPNTASLSMLETVALRVLSRPMLASIPAARLPGILARASAVTPDAIRRTEEVMARMPRRRFLDVWQATTALIDPDPDYRTPVPLALLRGEHDGTGNIARSMTAWAHTEGIAERVIADAGHVAMWDAPAATGAAVLDALAEIAG